MTDDQEHYDLERTFANRCPRCGSAKTSAGVFMHPEDPGSGMGGHCTDCGYLRDHEAVVYDRPFILPGDPGSHDQVSDYAPPDREDTP